MRSTRSRIFFVSIIICCAAARAAEPEAGAPEGGASAPQQPAAATTQPAGDATDRPFWLAPKVNPGLSVTAVTLVSAPDKKMPLGLLQVGADPRTFVVSNPMATPFVTGVDTGYELIPGGLKMGAVVYCDRKYAIQKLPGALSGLPLLRTRNQDKAVMDGRFAIVVTSARPCWVLVALDERALNTYQQFGTPGWLQEFAPTDYKIETDDPLMAAVNAGFVVYARKAPAGRIVLGPPSMDVEHNAMYFAFFGEAK